MCYSVTLVIVLSVVVCGCCKPTNICRAWAFSNSGLEVWLPAFQLPTFAKWDALPKKESIPAITFWNSKHPLPTRSFRFLRAAVRSAFWLHHAHPFVAASEKSTCLMQRSKAFGHAIVVSKMLWNIVIVLSVVPWDCCKPTNTCRDWAFSNSGLEVGLPAFQLPMFAKLDALPNGDLFTVFV